MKKNVWIFLLAASLTLLTINSSWAIDLGVGGNIGVGLTEGGSELLDNNGMSYNLFVQFLFLEASYNHFDFSQSNASAGFNTIDLAFRYNILSRTLRPYVLGGVGYMFSDLSQTATDGSEESQAIKGGHAFFGGGLDVKLGTFIAVGANLKYHFTAHENPNWDMLSGSTEDLGYTTRFFTFMAGASFWLL
jgi:hypothetical protein